MRASPYNNPLFAEGLAGLIEGYIGNPVSTAQAELMAAQALNENLTAQYRQGMDVGLSSQGSNLSDMMVRALQAGSAYSGNAPKISAAINQNNRGILGMPTGGGGGGGASSATDGGIIPKTTDLQRIMRLYLTEDQFDAVGPDVLEDITRQALENGIDPLEAILQAKDGIVHTPATPDTSWFGDNSTPESYTYTSPFGQPTAPVQAAPTTATQNIGQPNTQGLPQPATEADYQALPSGTRYMAPDGTVRVKP